MEKLSKMREPSALESGHRGFSLLETLIVVIVGFIIAGFAIPSYLSIRRNVRISGDGNDLNGEVVLAKMRAASAFTRARIYADLSANSFHIETWDKAASQWKTDGCPTGSPATCGIQYLAPSVSFGFGGLGTPPSGTQTTIGQAPGCLSNLTGGAGSTTAANTACVVFNSRGIPVDSTGGPMSQDALYITDGKSVFGITASATGLIRVWRSDAGSANWMRR